MIIGRRQSGHETYISEGGEKKNGRGMMEGNTQDKERREKEKKSREIIEEKKENKQKTTKGKSSSEMEVQIPDKERRVGN